MTTWDKICRICSSPAEYEVFEKIPSYLHGTTHEFMNWQKPINVLIEETTGLAVTKRDGLPERVCALCISYLKHASTFREQAIKNALSLKAIKLLCQKTNKHKKHVDKESLLITEQELNFTDERRIDTNLLLKNTVLDQDKVSKKQLLNNTVQLPSKQNIQQQMRYLNLLFDKDINYGIRGKYKNDTTITPLKTPADPPVGGGFQTVTSSDENEEGVAKQKHNIFSYKEKNFEEDDIMNLDALRNAITVSMPENCKERKCRACYRRFMFDDSFTEHMEACIEYRFLIFIEEINRLLDIRRNKGISPHEFIRRMIFCLRKTTDWLKENCDGTLLPDLATQTIDGKIDSVSKQRLESEGKSSATSSGEQTKQQSVTNEKLLKFRNNIINDTKVSESLPHLGAIAKDTNFGVLHATTKPLKSRPTTPISINNNILYEIERSQSRNSNQQNDFNLSDNAELKKPIAVLGNSATTASALQDNGGAHNETERTTFLEKLQRAACQTPTEVSNYKPATTPRITVRQDLLPLVQQRGLTPTTPILITACCKSCNTVFDSLASLEVHNAIYHNNLQAMAGAVAPAAAAAATDPTDDEERNRIIALFEDDNDEY